MKSQLLRWAVPARLQADSLARRHALRTVVFGLAMAFWAPVFAPIYYALGSPRAAGMIVLAGAAILASTASLRFTGSVLLTGQLIAGFVFAVLLGLAMVTGGTGSPSLWWLPSVPIIALLLCGVPSGVAWAAISCLTCLAFLLLGRWGVAMAEDLGPNQMQILNWAATSGIILCAFSLTLAFKLGEDGARRALETARQESEQASRAKSAFLANMSHEIRTPMNAILGMTRLLLETELSAAQREQLSIVVDSGESLLSIINDILDLTKIEADKIQLEHKPFSLEDSLFDVLRALALSAQEKKLELLGDLPLPAPLVVGDPVRLRQVLTNLIGNAIKFTAAGEVVVTATSEEASDGRLVVHLVVSDTGTGIPEDRLPHIFEPFEQADTSSTRRFGGTGLGLAIVSRLVQRMEGEIYVRSDVGQGSQFHVRLPFSATSERLSPVPGRTPKRFQGVRVLVVDDHCQTREVLARHLQSWGMVPTLAADGSQALAQLQRSRRDNQRFDILLVDWEMPAMSGLEFAAAACREEDLMPRIVFLLTAQKKAAGLPADEQCSAATCVLKPVKPSGLLDALCAVLQGQAASSPFTLRPQPLPAAPEKPLCVLMAEDSLVNQKVTAALLRKRGHDVVIVNNGKEAVEAARERPFDLILMDIQMPEMDGYDATAEIRARERSLGRHTPIIALTAHAMSGDRERCLQAGMDEYLTKPVRAESLFDMLDLVLHRSSPPNSQPESTPPRPPVDWRRALQALGGAPERLSTFVDAVIETLPPLVASVQQAIRAEDGAGLQQAARTFVETIRCLAAQDAIDAALALERLGRDDRFPQARKAAPAFAQLAHQILDACAEQVRKRSKGPTHPVESDGI